jgi:hypothetical protein
VYVLRPDQHVCSRWTGKSASRVAEVVRHVLAAGAQVAQSV